MKVIYKEIEEAGRYYYGLYEEDRANSLAKELNADGYEGIEYCVCDAEAAKDFNVKNLPLSLQ